jgi:hypothetical protein
LRIRSNDNLGPVSVPFNPNPAPPPNQFANQDTNDLPNFTPGPYNSLDPSTGNLLRRSLNLGSYNYLGFADDWNQTCKEDVVGTLEKWGVSNGGCRVEYGTTDMHRELEKLVADFLGKEVRKGGTKGRELHVKLTFFARRFAPRRIPSFSTWALIPMPPPSPPLYPAAI